MVRGRGRVGNIVRTPMIVCLAAALVAVGCGGTEDGMEEAATAPATEAAPSDGDATTEVTVAASEFALEAPEVVPAGEVTFTLENRGGLAHHAQLVQIPSSGVETFEDDDRFGMVMNDATALGGPATVEPQTTSTTVTTSLQPGTYAFLCMLVTDGSEHATRGMRTTFVVEGDRADADATEPATEGTIGLDEYAFDLPEGFDGQGAFLVENNGSLDHEMSIMEVADDATRSEVRAQLDAWGGAEVPAPDELTYTGGVMSLRFRKTQVIDLDLDPGTYAFICKVPNGTTKHWQEGMLTVLDVP